MQETRDEILNSQLTIINGHVVVTVPKEATTEEMEELLESFAAVNDGYNKIVVREGTQVAELHAPPTLARIEDKLEPYIVDDKICWAVRQECLGDFTVVLSGETIEVSSIEFCDFDTQQEEVRLLSPQPCKSVDPTTSVLINAVIKETVWQMRLDLTE